MTTGQLHESLTGKFLAGAHHRWLREELGIESIIPAIRSRPSRRLTRQPWRYRMQRWFPRCKYGQRWVSETVHSVIKRKFGEALTARRPWQRGVCSGA